MLSQAVIHGVLTLPLCLKTLAPEAWVVPCPATSHSTSREGPQLALPKDQSGKGLVILSMPSRRLMAAILGHGAGWAKQGQPQGENSIARLFYTSTGRLEWQELRTCWAPATND